jgi:hypothetical protein
LGSTELVPQRVNVNIDDMDLKDNT